MKKMMIATLAAASVLLAVANQAHAGATLDAVQKKGFVQCGISDGNRIKELAKILINYSVRAKEGEKVLIESRGLHPIPLVKALIKECHAVGALPFVQLNEPTITSELIMSGNEELFKGMDDLDLYRMKQMDCYIGIGSPENIAEMRDVPVDYIKSHQQITRRSFDQRVDGTRWVVLRYPNAAMAQLADMSQEAFEDFYFDVSTLDYEKMDKAMDALKELMEKTDKVRITGPATDLTFSIKGMSAIKCSGQVNIPDGEIYTAPIKDSVEGTLTYNTPSDYMGFVYSDICFEFKEGKIVKATSNDTERINSILDTDEGARYIGEFAIGVNPFIEKPMLETLFDEKIKGSFHFTPGQAYETADNGNKSSIHWDLVAIQREDYGGGEMYFDDVLIRKDGIFVLEELKALNPENLK